MPKEKNRNERGVTKFNDNLNFVEIAIFNQKEPPPRMGRRFLLVRFEAAPTLGKRPGRGPPLLQGFPDTRGASVGGSRRPRGRRRRKGGIRLCRITGE